MNFEDVLDQEKSELIEAFLVFGEGKRLNKVLADLEMNRPEFYKFYQAGQQSKQEEVDQLNCILDEVLKFCLHIKEGVFREHCQEYDKGWRDCAISIRHHVEMKKIKLFK